MGVTEDDKGCITDSMEIVFEKDIFSLHRTIRAQIAYVKVTEDEGQVSTQNNCLLVFY